MTKVVVGPSMYPTLKPDQEILVLVMKVDAVIKAFFVRALGHEGISLEQVKRLRNGNVQVDFENGPVLVYRKVGNNNMYVVKRLKQIMYIPESGNFYCWMEGDNPDNSVDSRFYGYVPLDRFNGLLVMESVKSLPRMVTKKYFNRPLKVTTETLGDRKKRSSVRAAEKKEQKAVITARRADSLGEEAISVPLKNKSEGVKDDLLVLEHGLSTSDARGEAKEEKVDTQ